MSPKLADFLGFLRRNLFGTICTVLIIGSAVATWFLWDDIDSLEHARDDRDQEDKEMLDTLKKGSSQREELAAVRTATHRIEDNLVIENNLAENYWYFFRFEEQAKARLPELHQLSSPSTDSSPLFRRVPYSIRVTGTYEQVAAFLISIESGPRLASITAFDFSRRAPGADSLTLDLTLELLGKR